MSDFFLGAGLVFCWISALTEYAGASALAEVFEWAALGCCGLLLLGSAIRAGLRGAVKKNKKKSV